jgi:hypothetical protein
MSNEQEKSKKSDIKIYITFAVVLVLCFVGGFLTGMGGANLQESIDAINWGEVAQSIFVPSVVLFVAMVVGVYGVCFWMYADTRKKLVKLETLEDEAFEEGLPEVEKNLNRILIIGGIGEILSFFLYPLIILCAETMKKADIAYASVLVMVGSVTFLVDLALFMTIMTLVVNQEKKLNPEKQGNVFDFRFRKQWLESMDEAEVMKTAQASQSACTAALYTCLALWLVAFIAMLSFHTGILPVMYVSIIMLVLYVVSAVKSM